MRRQTTYDKRLMELRAEQTLFPLITDDTTDSLGQTLLDSKVDAGVVIMELGVNCGVVLGRRRETRGGGVVLWLSLFPGHGWVHDDRFRDDGAIHVM